MPKFDLVYERGRHEGWTDEYGVAYRLACGRIPLEIWEIFPPYESGQKQRMTPSQFINQYPKIYRNERQSYLISASQYGCSKEIWEELANL